MTKRKKPNRAEKKRQFERKVAEYRTFLRGDEDWDYYFVLRLLRYKLERTRNCILKNDIVVTAPKIAKQIQAVEELLERVMEDRYYEEIAKGFHKKYGRARLVFGKAPKGAKSVPVTVRYRRETARNTRIISREFIKLRRKAWSMRQRDLRRAFALMQKNIWGWWD